MRRADRDGATDHPSSPGRRRGSSNMAASPSGTTHMRMASIGSSSSSATNLSNLRSGYRGSSGGSKNYPSPTSTHHYSSYPTNFTPSGSLSSYPKSPSPSTTSRSVRHPQTDTLSRLSPSSYSSNLPLRVDSSSQKQQQQQHHTKQQQQQHHTKHQSFSSDAVPAMMVPPLQGPQDGAERSASWGTPSKKNSLEDDVPNEDERKFADLASQLPSEQGPHPAPPPPMSMFLAGAPADTSSSGGVQSLPDNNHQQKELPSRTPSAAHSVSAAVASSTVPTSGPTRRPSAFAVNRPRRKESAVHFADDEDDTKPSAVAVKGGRLTEEEQVKIAMEESRREQQAAMGAIPAVASLGPSLSDRDIEEFMGFARNLRDAVEADAEINTELVETLLNDCISVEARIPVFAQDGDNFKIVDKLSDLGGIISHAIKLGRQYLLDNTNLPKPDTESSISLDIGTLVRDRDVFTLICTLRAQQDDRGLDAAIALMRFARDAAHGDMEMIRLRDEIRSSGGMHSLLTLFRSRELSYERKVVAALAVAYLVPSFIESSYDTPPSLSLKIVECIHFLSNARAVSPRGENISRKESFEAATSALTDFWISHLQPKLNSEASRAMVGVDKVSRQDSFPLRRARSVTPRGRNGAIFDQRREIMALRELLEVTVSLIVHIAKQSINENRSQTLEVQHRTETLVEQVCAIEIARPIAVREGILRVLVKWLESTTGGRAATVAMCYLTSIKDKYMAGWIHSEMVNQGAVAALVRFPPVEHEVRLATAEILASLCAAPHTRAAVVEAKCINFLIGFLPDGSESSSEQEVKVVVHAGNALVMLAAGAITRAVVLSGEDSDVHDFVSPDKSETLIDDIVEKGGAIAPFVALARGHQGKLRSIAVEALRVLSEDVGPARQTRRKLCDAGALEALGIALKDDVGGLNANLPFDRAFAKFPSDSLKQIHEALSALANILDPVQNAPKTLERSTSSVVLESVLIKGCLDATRSGGLKAILKIAMLPFTVSDPEVDSSVSLGPNFNLLEESCRSLASIAPLLLKETVAKSGLSSGAHGVLNALHGILKQLVSTADMARYLDSPDIHDRLEDLREVVLQGLGALAKSDALKTWIVDRTLRYLMRSVGAGGFPGASNMLAQALQALDFGEDEIAVQAAGNNPDLLADWYCLQRSLLIQAMARSEIRQVVSNTWESSFLGGDYPGVTTLIRCSSDKTLSDDGGLVPPELFCNFAVDANSSEKRNRLIQQYNDIYGNMSEPDYIDTFRSVDTSEGDFGNTEGLLSKQIFPLNNFSTEKHWVLQHRKVLEEPPTENCGTRPALSPHVNALLNSCFPSALLKEQIVPVSRLSPKSSFNFRALMLPQRNYFSFRREGQLVSRICDQEVSKVDGTDVHWTLGFTNSSFAGEFAESLVQLLYQKPMICGLSFSNEEGAERGEGGGLLASLAGSLPAWVSHLTFDGTLGKEELSQLVRVFETMGKLSVGQDGSKQDSHSHTTNTQGKFSFLAVRRTWGVTPSVWKDEFFGLFKSTWNPTKRPLACLKSLDLSSNNLGDALCASMLHIVYNDESPSCLEELDLSDNGIGSGRRVIQELKDGKTSRRGDKALLRTLRLASNNLNTDHAWLDILRAVQPSVIGLRHLDLSSNEISLMNTEYHERDSLITSLTKNKELVQLNLSNNRLGLSTVDDVLRRLVSEPRESRLGFLHLDNNDPFLTPEQTEHLNAFSEKSRSVLLDRYMEELECGVEDQPNEDVVPGFDGDDVSVPSLPPRPADTESAAVSLPEPATSSNALITVLFSAPLVYKHITGEVLPFPKLNLDMERELIWQCLKEASRDIELAYDNATSDRLLAAMAHRCTCLHYSGHGHEHLLPFEDETGGSAWFPVGELRKLIEREGSAPFDLVFVSACHSGHAGHTFAAAGVPHVVCCRQESELNDVAALRFTRQFYLALAVGNTVRESFEQGCRAVGATARLRNAQDERDKFILLPQDGNHDVPIFEAKPVREWPKYLSQYASRRDLTASRTHELKVRNLIQEDPSPSPPQFFLGREVDMQKTLYELSQRRLVSVVGEPGIGRSSLICAVCHYINERKNIVAPWLTRIYFVKAKKYRKKNRFTALAMQLLELLVDEGQAEPVLDDEDVDDIVDSICRGLQREKALVVFDRVELLQDEEDLNDFKMLLVRSLCRDTSSVKILLTNTVALGIPSLGEHHIKLGPLNLEDTIRLFAHVCPFIHSSSERKNLLDSLLPGEKGDEEGALLPTDGLPPHIDRIFQVLGRGVPARIENAAYSIEKDEILPRLMDGTIRYQELELATVVSH